MEKIEEFKTKPRIFYVYMKNTKREHTTVFIKIYYYTTLYKHQNINRLKYAKVNTHNINTDEPTYETIKKRKRKNADTDKISAKPIKHVDGKLNKQIF